MTTQQAQDASEGIDRLAKFLVDETLAMTDEEILEEAQEDGEDVSRIAQEARGIFEVARKSNTEAWIK